MLLNEKKVSKHSGNSSALFLAGYLACGVSSYGHKHPFVNSVKTTV